jgi:hypothetical protein
MKKFMELWHPMLNADAGAEGGAEPSTEPAGENANGGGNTGNENAGTEDKKPFAVFPDEASFMGRVGREAKKQVGEFLKSLGIEKEDELKNIIQNHKETIENNKTELQKAMEAAQNAQREKDELFSSFTSTMKQNEAKVKALALGIKPERLEYILKLIDLNSIEVVDGKIDSQSIEDSLNGILKEFPELKANNPASQQKAGQDFSQPTATPDLLTMEAIKAMSVEEAERRLPDILKFMNKK